MLSDVQVCARCGKEIELGKPIFFKDGKSFHPECWYQYVRKDRQNRWGKAA